MSSFQKTSNSATGFGSGKIATTTTRPRRQASSVVASMPAADARDLEHDVGAGAVGRARHARAATSSAPGSSASSPSSPASAAARGRPRSTTTRGPARARDERDQQPDRAAADHDGRLACPDLAATDVVAGDRQRLRERAEPQVDVRRQRVQREGGHRPRALERAGRVDAEELQVAADVAEAPVGRRLAARCRAAGRRPRRRAGSPRRRRRPRRPCPDISCPITCGGRRAHPWRRGRCAGRCRRRRSRRPRAAPRRRGVGTALSHSPSRKRPLPS